ncbi:hypothetical protein GJ496_007123 [Pomphorhynchus laevis]|nr:hypothetical protein GJ496_007123 [Pomphorhynchus laevis]
MLSNSAAAPVERVHPLIALDIPRESDVVHNQTESTARQLTLHDIYEIVITWPPALLDPPRCNATNEFVDIMADLYYQASEDVHFNPAPRLRRQPCSLVVCFRESKVVKRRSYAKLWNVGWIFGEITILMPSLTKRDACRPELI